MEFDTIWREYDLDSFQSGIRRLFPEYGISLEKLLGFVMSGDLKGGILYLGQRGIGGVTEQIGAIKNIFVWLLVMGIVSALFIQFADVFDRNQIADISFYYVYLTVSYVLLECFLRASQIAVSTMENVILFVKLLVPTYLFAVGIAGGAAEAVSSSQLLILTIFGVENLLQRILIPIIYSYVFLTLVNCVWTEEKLSLLMELLKKMIDWMLKAALGVVTGLSVFQSAIMPIMDSVRVTAVQKALSALPGVGNVADSMVELMAGSALFIRNSIGVILLLLLMVLCMAPLSHIFLIAFMLKGAAAMMGIVSDKRITSCADHVGDASMLLLRTATTALLLFFIVIAIVAMTVGMR